MNTLSAALLILQFSRSHPTTPPQCVGSNRADREQTGKLSTEVKSSSQAPCCFQFCCLELALRWRRTPIMAGTTMMATTMAIPLDNTASMAKGIATIQLPAWVSGRHQLRPCRCQPGQALRCRRPSVLSELEQLGLPRRLHARLSRRLWPGAWQQRLQQQRLPQRPLQHGQ